MDMKPILLPQGEVQARKARDLKRRGYSVAEIAAAMGIREDRAKELLHSRGAAPDPGKGIAPASDQGP